MNFSRTELVEKMETAMKIVTERVFLYFLFLYVLASASSDSDAASLVSFKHLVEHDPSGVLRSWNPDSGSSPCSWYGVSCSDGEVVGLDLKDAGLVGCLKIDVLMGMESLKTIQLHGNSFYGDLSGVPPSCSFETIDLSSNNLSERIVDSVFRSCSRLISVNLSRNSIPGVDIRMSPTLLQLDLSRNRISDIAVLSSTLSNCHNLKLLNFSDNKLGGGLNDFSVSSCENLSSLDLSYNVFSEEIPTDLLSSLPLSLKLIDLSHNNMSGDFSKINFRHCENLITIDLSYNRLSGVGIPASLGSCEKLEKLDLSWNSIGGKIPTVLGEFKSLQKLFLSKNQFGGEIPPELGRTCKTLKVLDLSDNRLIGGLPSTFIGCSALVSLHLGNNQLSGDFLHTVVSTMPALKHLSAPFNNVTGSIPPSLSNCTDLEVIDLSSNELKGNIPLGFCSSFNWLRRIVIANNFLSGSFPAELGRCRALQSVDLSFNDLNGQIPSEIWRLPELLDLTAWANRITGEIPDDICRYAEKLQTLILNNNMLSGAIPSALTNCTNLIWVSFSNNRLTGEIPAALDRLPNLAVFQLGNNCISGEIPRALGSIPTLIWLDLSGNNLTGPVPGDLANQAGGVFAGPVSGKRFAFVRNEGGSACRGVGGLLEFEGVRIESLLSFPLVHSCHITRIYTGTTVYTFRSNGSLIYLDLSYNSLTGQIPIKFGSMYYLQVLNLGHNKLTGTIPASLGGLKQVGILDVSYNYLEGNMPGSLVSLNFLSDFDVSNNKLTGRIPASGQLTTFPASRYENNSGLCGLPLPPCNSSRQNSPNLADSENRHQPLAVTVVAGVMVALLFSLALSVALIRVRRHGKTGQQGGQYMESLPTSSCSSWKLTGAAQPLSISVATFEKPLRKLTFAHLLEATNGFSAESLIGAGGFGEVFKARLRDGCTVAIKKLLGVTGQADREFTAEMETVGKIRHRNLVPLLGYCKIGEERLLVYEYMKWGSLESVLHDRSRGRSKRLDWAARKKIAIGAARGLAFLHHSCLPHIIHRDLKSSNVLLDENLEARISDFGMARLMNALDTHLSVSTLAGTPGYVPPEYYQSFQCTTKGDVYSYGVVLLELLSGKRPIDQSEFGDNNLVGWAKQLVKEKRTGEIFDPELKLGKAGETELCQYLNIACECLDHRPLRRPTMIQVMAMFKELQVDSHGDLLDWLHLNADVIEENC